METFIIRRKRKNFVGKKFGRWKVISEAPDSKGKVMWNCLCECGNTNIVRGETLTSGVSKSCGCLRDELAKVAGGNFFKGYEQISGGYFSRMKKDAKRRNLEFKVTLEYLWNLYLSQNKRCRFSNLPLVFQRNYNKGFRHLQTASLDRIDSSKGYIEGNLQWVHKDINYMKYTLEESKFLYYIKTIYENQKL